MKTKVLIPLLISIITGFVIGYLTAGRMTRSKVEKIKSWNTREGFRNHLFDIMQADEKQQQQLQPLLDSFSDLHWQLTNKHWETQNGFYDAMYETLEPLISNQQHQRLLEHRDMIRKERAQKKQHR